MYSRNIPMTEKRIVCFQRKYIGFCISIVRDILKNVTNDFLAYSGGQLL